MNVLIMIDFTGYSTVWIVWLFIANFDFAGAWELTARRGRRCCNFGQVAFADKILGFGGGRFGSGSVVRVCIL